MALSARQAIQSGLISREQAEGLGLAVPKGRSNRDRIAECRQAVQACDARAEPDGTQGLILRFEGARLLTENQMLRLDNRMLNSIRRTWHRAVLRASEQVQAWRGIRVSGILGRYHHPGPPRDTRGLSLPFKHPEDGLVHAGVLPDDSPRFVPRFSVEQVRSKSYRVELYLSLPEGIYGQ